MPTRCNRWFLLQILLLGQNVSGHHYAHHQELESIIQVVAACRIWCFGFQVVGTVWSWGLCVRFAGCSLPSAPHHTDNLKTKAPNTTGSIHLYNTLKLLMMGIMVPETYWASNKFCNKNHLLHLIGILFPHINHNYVEHFYDYHMPMFNAHNVSDVYRLKATTTRSSYRCTENRSSHEIPGHMQSFYSCTQILLPRMSPALPAVFRPTP